MTAIFLRETDGAWTATPLARGPFEGVQGGAAAALMTSAAELEFGDLLSSITTHFLRPAPLGRLKVALRPVRIGRRVSVVDAELACEELGVVAVQRLTRIAPAPFSGLPCPPPEPFDPTCLPTADLPQRRSPWIMETIDVRQEPGGRCWFRQKVPLFQPFSTLCRLITVADFAHGMTMPLGCEVRPNVAFPNTDVTVHVFRRPKGEWVGVDAATVWTMEAIGAGWGALYDTEGLVGRVAMSVAIMPLKEEPR